MLVCPVIAGKQEHYVSVLDLFVESKYSLTIGWFTSAVGFNVVNNTCDCSNRNQSGKRKGKTLLFVFRTLTLTMQLILLQLLEKKERNKSEKRNQCKKTSSAFN